MPIKSQYLQYLDWYCIYCSVNDNHPEGNIKQGNIYNLWQPACCHNLHTFYINAETIEYVDALFLTYGEQPRWPSHTLTHWLSVNPPECLIWITCYDKGNENQRSTNEEIFLEMFLNISTFLTNIWLIQRLKLVWFYTGF